jgi:pyrimidine operon attenuation protein/uracil phosphoribosyltransferase
VSARTVLSSEDIDRAVTRIAHEILEANTAVQKSAQQKSGTKNLVILGIPTRGVLLLEHSWPPRHHNVSRRLGS